MLELSVGSLFSGIGGIELGLERTGGFRTEWFAEIDPFASAVLHKHWPDVPNLGDVRNVGAETPRVDLIAAGFPCQPVSLAGKRLAQEDPRWLWPQVARIVGDLRPRYVLLENVPGLRSKGLGDVLADLSALGYDAEWEGIPARAVGAPHRRDRIWIIAYPRGERLVADSGGVDSATGRTPGDLARPQGTLEGEREQREWGGDAVDDSGADVADSERSGLQGRPGEGDAGARRPRVFTTGGGERSWAAVESDLGRAPHGVSAWLDGSWEREIPRIELGVVNRTHRLKALGNAVVPQVAEVVGRLILEDAAA